MTRWPSGSRFTLLGMLFGLGLWILLIKVWLGWMPVYERHYIWLRLRHYQLEWWRMLEVPFILGGSIFLCMLLLGSMLDSRSNRLARAGTLIRGPRLISWWRFNLPTLLRRKKGFYIESRIKVLRWLIPVKLYLNRDHEAQHLQICGATGTRKSSMLRRLIYQAYERGWPIVALDLNRELLREFYRPDRDFLIDPMDERCVRWMLSREALDEPHAMAIAEGAFPNEPLSSFFFLDHARGLLAYLLGNFHPTTSELADWMAHPDLIDLRVIGTEYASTLSKNSAEQRNGILGTLNHLGRPLRWMPDEAGRREFCVRDWAQHRSGSIFLSSTPDTFQALRPMQSLIFDMVLLAMQTHPGPGFVVADEVGEFQRSPQLERALSMIRKAGNPIALAYQGFSQLQTHNGDKVAESLTNNPYTNIVLRQQGTLSTEHASKLLAMPAEIERIRESRPSSMFRGFMDRGAMHGSYNSERNMSPPVTPGELQSLPPGIGYLAQAGKIVKLNIAYAEPVFRNDDIQPREIPFRMPLPGSVPPQTSYRQRRIHQKLAN